MKNLKSPFNSYIRNSQNDSDVAQTVIILQLYKKSNQFYHFGKDAEPKFYASPVYHGTLDIDDICAEISEKTALTPSEVHGVINGLLSSVPKYMLLGYKVRLNGLGIFRYAFSGIGKATSEEVVHTDIKNERIHYAPDVKLKSKMSSPEYTRV